MEVSYIDGVIAVRRGDALVDDKCEEKKTMKWRLHNPTFPHISQAVKLL